MVVPVIRRVGVRGARQIEHLALHAVEQNLGLVIGNEQIVVGEALVALIAGARILGGVYQVQLVGIVIENLLAVGCGRHHGVEERVLALLDMVGRHTLVAEPPLEAEALVGIGRHHGQRRVGGAVVVHRGRERELRLVGAHRLHDEVIRISGLLLLAQRGLRDGHIARAREVQRGAHRVAMHGNAQVIVHYPLVDVALALVVNRRVTQLIAFEVVALALPEQAVGVLRIVGDRAIAKALGRAAVAVV